MINAIDLGASAVSSKKTKIMEIAYEMFIEEGYWQTSMDMLAKKAAVSKATLYSYFSSKDALFEEIMIWVIHAFGTLPDAIVDDSATPIEKLKSFSSMMVVSLRNRGHTELLRRIIGEMHNFPKLGAVFWDTGPQNAIDFISKIFKQLDEEGTISCTDPDIAANEYMTMIVAPYFLPNLLGVQKEYNEEKVKENLENSVNRFLKGMGR